MAVKSPQPSNSFSMFGYEISSQGLFSREEDNSSTTNTLSHEVVTYLRRYPVSILLKAKAKLAQLFKNSENNNSPRKLPEKTFLRNDIFYKNQPLRLKKKLSIPDNSYK